MRVLSLLGKREFHDDKVYFLDDNPYFPLRLFPHDKIVTTCDLAEFKAKIPGEFINFLEASTIWYEKMPF